MIAGVPLPAHGVGAATELPLPFTDALIGAAVALVASFVALLVLWRTPRLGRPAAGFALPRSVQAVADSNITRAVLRGLGLLFAAYVTMSALAGKNVDENPTPYVVFVIFWIGLVAGSLAFGPVWRLLNPLRTMTTLIGWVRAGGAEPAYRPIPRWLGYWPAAVGLVVFTWLELVYPRNIENPLGPLITFFACYAVVHLVAGFLFGPDWFTRGDAFEAYSSLVARLSPFGRRSTDRRLVIRNPLDGLAMTRGAPGLVAVVTVLFGSTMYDALSGTSWWENHGPVSSSVGDVVLRTLVELGVILAVAGSYVLATRLSAPQPEARASMPQTYAHTMVPILVGYAIAHYFSLAVFDGQLGLILLSDPLQTGANLFGLTGHAVNVFISASGIAAVEIGAIIVGHILGVVAAHDRATAVLPRQRLVRGQLPLLGLMVCYTVVGIYLFFVR
ncbi:MAG: hypothetical protein ACJ735_05770 [Actinomycetes bacterium]